MAIDFKQDILAPVANDFAAMDTFINEGITSKVALVMAVSKHVVEAGGKRMRPIMCLLAAKACGAVELEQHRKLAAIIEMLHTATLVHDDVVDESGLRRGRPTANATWNNQTAVLVGDFLISRAFDLLVDLNNMTLLKDLYGYLRNCRRRSSATTIATSARNLRRNLFKYYSWQDFSPV